METNNTLRLLLYFLRKPPEGTEEAAKPFEDLAQALVDAIICPYVDTERLTQVFARMAFELHERLEFGSPEAKVAAEKIAMVIRQGAWSHRTCRRDAGLDRWLRLLLEARDCAIRAAEDALRRPLTSEEWARMVEDYAGD
jgi:hypothetical protein